MQREEDLTILAYSLLCMALLKSQQLRDFPLWLYWHPVLLFLMHPVSLINACVEAGRVTTFIKFQSH